MGGHKHNKRQWIPVLPGVDLLVDVPTSEQTQRIDFVAPTPTNELADRAYLDQPVVTTEHVATVRMAIGAYRRAS